MTSRKYRTDKLTTMKQLSAVILVVLLVGCAETNIGSWVGRSSADLISAWGEPKHVANIDGGGKVLTWDRLNLGISCRAAFTLNPDGVVDSVSGHGC
jgi:hypothetical protein